MNIRNLLGLKTHRILVWGDKDSIEGRSVVGSTWMSGLRLRVVIVWAAVCAIVLRWYKYITKFQIVE